MVFTPGAPTTTQKNWYFRILPISIFVSIFAGMVLSDYSHKGESISPPPYVFMIVWSAIYFLLAMSLISLGFSDNNGLNLFGHDFEVSIARRFYKWIILNTMWAFIALIAVTLVYQWEVFTPFQIICALLVGGWFAAMSAVLLFNVETQINDDAALEVNGKVFLTIFFFVYGMINGAWSIFFTNFGDTNFIVKYFACAGIFAMIALKLVIICLGSSYVYDLNQKHNYITLSVFGGLYLLVLGGVFFKYPGSRIGIGIALSILGILLVVVLINRQFSLSYLQCGIIWLCIASALSAKEIRDLHLRIEKTAKVITQKP